MPQCLLASLLQNLLPLVRSATGSVAAPGPESRPRAVACCAPALRCGTASGEWSRGKVSCRGCAQTRRPPPRNALRLGGNTRAHFPREMSCPLISWTRDNSVHETPSGRPCTRPDDVRRGPGPVKQKHRFADALAAREHRNARAAPPLTRAPPPPTAGSQGPRAGTAAAPRGRPGARRSPRRSSRTPRNPPAQRGTGTHCAPGPLGHTGERSGSVTRALGRTAARLRRRDPATPAGAAGPGAPEPLLWTASTGPPGVEVEEGPRIGRAARARGRPRAPAAAEYTRR